MSNLLKQALTKGKPPKPEQPEFNEDEENSDEEEKDQFEDPTSKKAVHKEFPHFGTGPIRAIPIGLPPSGKTKDQNDSDPNQIDIHQRFQGSNKSAGQFSPLKWNDYYDSMEFMENGTPIYISGNQGPLFFCLHGAGDSACSFACLAKEIKQFGMTVAFDFRGHGESKIQSSDDLSIDTLIDDTVLVFQYVQKKFPDLCIVIVGHSMGGSVASKFTERVYQQDAYKDIIQGKLFSFYSPLLSSKTLIGLIVIDVVEGTAIEALPYMENIVSSRPQRFDSLESVVRWHTRTNQIRNLESARVSAPPKVRAVEKDGKQVYEWKVDLMKSEKHWMSWFKGLTGSFLSVHLPKLLMLAEKERMDKDLTIAQMQGKFKLVVIQDVGHYMQEDNFKKTAFNLHLFLDNFRIPVDKADFDIYKEQGIGKFHPNIKPYNMKA